MRNRLLRSLTPLTAMHSRPPTVNQIMEGMRGYLQVPTGVVDARGKGGLFADEAGTSTIARDRQAGFHERYAENEDVAISDARQESESDAEAHVKVITGMSTVKELDETEELAGGFEARGGGGADAPGPWEGSRGASQKPSGSGAGPIAEGGQASAFTATGRGGGGERLRI